MGKKNVGNIYPIKVTWKLLVVTDKAVSIKIVSSIHTGSTKRCSGITIRKRKGKTIAGRCQRVVLPRDQLYLSKRNQPMLGKRKKKTSRAYIWFID